MTLDAFEVFDGRAVSAVPLVDSAQAEGCFVEAGPIIQSIQ